MTVIAIVSMKGGVGKTSTTANLATALVRLGLRVTVLDLDPQNSLFLHFGLSADWLSGIAVLAGDNPASLSALAQPSPAGAACIPYGVTTAAQRADFEQTLEDQPAWLHELLAKLGLDNDDNVVLIDTPPGPSVYLRQAFACADLALMVLLADGASYATIPAMEAWVADWTQTRPSLQARYLLNQLDAVSSLSHDVAEVLRQRLGARIAPIGVHRDEAVGEALAVQQSVLSYDPYGQATQDYQQLAAWLARHLA